MEDLSKDIPSQLSLGVNLTLVKLMCGSPAGMGQLMKYFDSQCKRLDKQSIPSHPPAVNPDFVSFIKFNGVPILPPVITASRREELRQAKKDAMLLEKRLRARHKRQQINNEADATEPPRVTFPETTNRPTARQLNFDAGADQEDVQLSPNPSSRFGATNPISTFATADNLLTVDEFGLQTLDSVNSDFMSLDESAIPTVYNGLALTSYKEQKISYDLDRLSKVLNVQDMTSTSGSDISDPLGNTQTFAEEDIQSAQHLARKLLAKQHQSDRADGQSTSFFHESQDTVVEVSPSSEEKPSGDSSSTSGFVNDTTSHTEQAETSSESSPGCGSANTTGTTDSQRSNRGSSPKSLKNAVHFASFVTEYNTTSSQLFERPMIVKKKLPRDQIAFSGGVHAGQEGSAVPIIGDPSETRFRKGPDGSDSGNALLNRVSFNPDSDSSNTPNTPPFDPSSGVPFQSYGRSESYSSDKENDASRGSKVSPQGQQRRVSDHGNRARHTGSEGTQFDQNHRHRPHHHHSGRQRRTSEGDSHGDVQQNIDMGHGESTSVVRHIGITHALSVPASIASGGIGPQSLHMRSKPSQVGSSQTSVMEESTQFADNSTGPNILTINSGQISVSDSQASSKSNLLTGTSESSSSTIKEDLSARDSTNLSMNIIVAGHGSVSLLESDGKSEEKSSGSAVNAKDDKGKVTSPVEPDYSPKKLNIDVAASRQEETTSKSNAEETGTPPRTLIRRGSYTLSEPSPALVRARSKQKEEDERLKTGAADVAKQSESSGVRLTSNQRQEESTLSKQEEKPSPQQAHQSFSDAKNLKEVEIPETVTNRTMPSDAEREGKAEHINKYLNQVFFQNSMNLSTQSWDTANIAEENSNDLENTEEELMDQYNAGTMDSSLVDVLRSLTESIGSTEHLSVEELLVLHQKQMDEKTQSLMNEQQKALENLFVQQRRERMLFEAELKAAQQMEKERQDFLIQNLPENLKVKARNHTGEFSPQHTGTLEDNYRDDGGGGDGLDLSVNEDSANLDSSAMESLDNRRPYSSHRTGGGISSGVFHQQSSGSPRLHLQTKSLPLHNQGKVGKQKDKHHGALYKHPKKINVTPALSTQEDAQTKIKRLADDSFSPRPNPPVDPVGLTFRIPEMNSPSISSPRIHRPLVLRSPYKTTPHRREGKVFVPPEAFLPENQVKFERVSAVAKGFLTRCLMRSDKVQELIKTIKDTREFAFQFQTETPVKKGVFTPQDRALLERIVAQLQAALLDIHEIFFEIPCDERMSLIEQTRLKDYNKRVKLSRDSLGSSGPRISQATLKALERKRKAKEAEASALLSVSRPKTAPPSTSSPRCQSHTDIRALKPLQSQSHFHSHSTKADVSRSDKERPRTAPEKQLTKPKRITALGIKASNTANTSISSGETSKESHKEASSKSASSIPKTVFKTKVAPSKQPARPTKSWR